MNAIKYLASAAALLTLAFGSASCSEEDKTEPDTSTKIYLTVEEGKTNIHANYTDEITVSLELSSAVAAETQFTLGFTGTDAAAMTVIDNPVTVAAGSTSTSFKVKTTGVEVQSVTTLTLAVENVPAGFAMTQPATFTVSPSTAMEELTEEQIATIAGIRSSAGFDLTPWMGFVELTGTIEFPGDGAREAFVSPATITLGGTTGITLGSEASATRPTITMAVNPMGMADYLLESFLNLTVKDKEYFAYDEDPEAAPESVRLMELLNWNANSAETFSVELPNIEIANYDPETETADLIFVKEGTDKMLDREGNPIYVEALEDDYTYGHESWIPFTYGYSAWTRNLNMFAAGDPEIAELLTYATVADPKVYLGISDVNYDYWELEENNLYTEPKGSIDFKNGKMTFEFPFDHADQNGYSRVKVTYSLAK